MGAILLSLAAGMAGGVLSQALPLNALGDWSTAFWNNLLANKRLEPQTILQLRLWSIIDQEEYLKQMRFHGYSEDRAAMALLTNSNWLDPISIVRAGWRESKSEPGIVADLVSHGWIETEAQRFLIAAKFYPNPADLVRWQAREVFEPDMVQRYGLDDEFGNIEKEPFFRAGMDEEQMRNYWRAHWEHPSWTEIQEMLHRDQITEKDVYDWFRLVEIPPYWRDKLTAVSYKPYTRVDVRRMHKLEVIDDEELTRAYQDLGYNRERAEKMRDFTIEYNQQVGEDPDLDLTRSMLEKAYRIGMLSPSEFDDYLEELGYSDRNATFIRTIVDQDISLDHANDWISILRNKVGAGLIDIHEAGRKLSELGLSDESVQHYEQLFSMYVEEPTKVPSKTDIKNFIAGEIISPEQGAKYMKAIGYGAVEIDRYIKLWLGSEERYAEWVSKMRELGQR